jgi:hypothetical protein
MDRQKSKMALLLPVNIYLPYIEFIIEVYDKGGHVRH